MSTAADRIALIERNLEEVLTHEDLEMMVRRGEPLRHYIGFEISGRLHLGTGLMSMFKVKDFMDAGVECNILLADWHTWINDKLGGDLDVIRRVAVRYFTEGFKASLACIGGDPERLNFVLGTEVYQQREGFWETVIDVSKHVTLARVVRSVSIMGREAGESIDFAKLIYPPLQVADIFFLGINLPHGGIEQRKAHVIARDVATKLSISPLRSQSGEVIKPIAVHHPILLGLQAPPVWPVPEDDLRDMWVDMKMSKSKPDSAIFIHDSPDEIRRKMRQAFCPPDNVTFNPVLDWARQLIFRAEDAFLGIKRDPRHGGDVTYTSYDELESAYRDGHLHPMDLKGAVAQALIDLLEPVRRHFALPEIHQMWMELEELITNQEG